MSSTSSSVASVAAGPARCGSTPFSQRFEPSVRSRSRSEVRKMPVRLEVRRLEQDVGRRLADLRLLAAHDPGERDRALAVGDHQVGRLELPVDAVERAQRLARPRAPHDDPLAGERREVEGVERVAEREHDVVRDVDDVRDRPHPGRERAARAARPATGRSARRGRGGRRSAGSPPSRRSRSRAARRRLALGVASGRRRELELVERRDLARHAVDREQVGPVAGRPRRRARDPRAEARPRAACRAPSRAAP